MTDLVIVCRIVLMKIPAFSSSIISLPLKTPTIFNLLGQASINGDEKYIIYCNSYVLFYVVLSLCRLHGL